MKRRHINKFVTDSRSNYKSCIAIWITPNAKMNNNRKSCTVSDLRWKI